MRRVALLSAAVLIALAFGWSLRLQSMRDKSSTEDGRPADSSTLAPPPALAARPRTAQRDRDPGGAKVGTSPADPPAARTAAGLAIRIHVVADVGGDPVADADVLDVPSRRTVGRSVGRTDLDGNFAVVLPRSFPYWAQIGVRHAGFAPAVETCTQDTVCEVRLARAVPIHGRVVLGSSSAPVGGASVWAFDERSGEPLHPQATTDAQGRFAFDDAASSGTVEILARIDGRSTAVLRNVRVSDDEIVVSLPDGGVLEGTATDDRGRPLATSVVAIVKPDDRLPERSADEEGRMDPRSEARLNRVTTDSAGHYEIAGVALGEPRVAVVEETPMLVGRSEPATFQHAGERIRRDVRVKAPGSLRIVAEGLSKETFAGFRLSLREAGLDLTVEEGGEHLPADGTWFVASLTPGRWAILIASTGFPFESRSIDVAAGATAELRVSFRGGLAVEGDVVDADGRPMPHAHVWLEGTAPAVTDTDEAGRFRFGGLAASPVKVIAMGGREFDRALAEGVVPGGAPVRLVLQRAARIRVRLLGLDANASVSAEMHGPTASGWPPCRVKGDGVVEVDVGVTGRPFALALRADKSGPVVIDVPALGSGETRDLGSRTLEPPTATAIRVVDARGEAVPNADVKAWWWNDVHDSKTDGDGVASFTALPPIPLFMVVNAKPRDAYLFVLPGRRDAPTELRLEEEGKIEIRVLDHDGHPVPRASVEIHAVVDSPEAMPIALSATADDAGVASKAIQPRTYRLRVRSDLTGAEASVDPVVVTSRQTTRVEAHLP